MSPAMKQRALDALHRLPPRRRLLAVVGLVLAIGCVVGLWFVQRDTADEVVQVTEDRDKAAQAGQQIADPVLAACGRTTRLASELRSLGLCQRAREADAVIESATNSQTETITPAGLDESDVETIVARVLARSPLLTEEQVVGVVTDYLAANPAAAGRDGTDGRDGPTVAEVRALVADVYAANPPAPGQNGQDGADSTVPGPNGKPGSDGTDGSDGRGVTSAAITGDGDLVLTFTDGTSSNLGRVVGRDGAAGADGTPGAPGTAQPGTYTCGEDEVMRGFTVGPDGGVTLDCRPAGLLSQ